MPKTIKRSTESVKRHANRNVAVFVSLFATLALTSLLLLALATPPLTSSHWRSLFAVDTPETLDALFQTQVPVVSGRWRYIYVHHSRTPSGDEGSLGQAGSEPGLTKGFTDHFVIGNGDGCGDGEVQMTQSWNHQKEIKPDLTPPGLTLSSTCISVCVVGDFNRGRPTPQQERRLVQLVTALQAQLRIPAGAVFVHSDIESAAGTGRAFPAKAFREQLLR